MDHFEVREIKFLKEWNNVTMLARESQTIYLLFKNFYYYLFLITHKEDRALCLV